MYRRVCARVCVPHVQEVIEHDAANSWSKVALDHVGRPIHACRSSQGRVLPRQPQLCDAYCTWYQRYVMPACIALLLPGSLCRDKRLPLCVSLIRIDMVSGSMLSHLNYMLKLCYFSVISTETGY